MTEPELLRLALREIRDDDGVVPMPAPAARHQQPTREVFDRAAALTGHPDPARREPGVRILRELGEERSGGRRPFHEDTVAAALPGLTGCNPERPTR